MQTGRWLAILGLALLAGCSTPVGTTYTEMSVALPPLKPGEGRIFFYTPKSEFGGDIQPEIRLNGKAVGFAIPSGFFYVDRPAGNYAATGLVPADGALAISLAAGETRYVRARSPSLMAVNAVQFLLVPAPEGQADMAGLAYSGVSPP